MLRPSITWMLLAFLVAPASVSAAGGSIPTEIPGKGTARDQGKPIWISAERAVVDGSLRRELFSPIALSQLDWAMKPGKAPTKAGPRESLPPSAPEADESRCDVWTSAPNDWTVTKFSLSSLLDHAQMAFVGTVVDVQEGFFYGFDTTLVEVQIDGLLKAPAGREGVSTVFLSYPYASIRVGNDMLCRRGPRFPARPTVGRRILVFAADVLEWDPAIINPTDDEIFFENPRGEVVFPAHVGSVLNPPAWDEFVGDHGQFLASNLVDR